MYKNSQMYRCTEEKVFYKLDERYCSFDADVLLQAKQVDHEAAVNVQLGQTSSRWHGALLRRLSQACPDVLAAVEDAVPR